MKKGIQMYHFQVNVWYKPQVGSFPTYSVPLNLHLNTNNFNVELNLKKIKNKRRLPLDFKSCCLYMINKNMFDVYHLFQSIIMTRVPSLINYMKLKRSHASVSKRSYKKSKFGLQVLWNNFVDHTL